MVWMSQRAVQHQARWYRSFYFRIGFSFVIFVVALIVAQNAIFSYIISRARPFNLRPPNTVAAIVAADLGAALTQKPDLDLQEYVSSEYKQLQPMAVVMKDGRVASNRPEPLADDIRRSADAVLAGTN